MLKNNLTLNFPNNKYDGISQTIQDLCKHMTNMRTNITKQCRYCANTILKRTRALILKKPSTLPNKLTLPKDVLNCLLKMAKREKEIKESTLGQFELGWNPTMHAKIVIL